MYRPIRRVLDHIIRSSYGHGVILLCDCGFENNAQLPPWLKGKLFPEMRFAEMLNELNEFCKNIERRTQWIKVSAFMASVRILLIF